jgi:hypothetical protein
MPYDLFANQDEEEKQQGIPSGQKSLAPSGGIIDGGTPGGGGPKGNSGQPTHSGSWTNLDAYLDANQDQHFGSQLAGKVQGDVDAATAAQQKADSGFKSQVDAASASPDQNFVEQAIQNPTDFVKNADQVSRFNKMRDASYQGPNSLTDVNDLYQPAYQATQQADQSGQSLGTEGGRFALLDRYFSDPQYNQGEKTLDNLLAVADSNAPQAFQTAQQSAQGVKSGFGNLTQQDQDYATTAKQNTQQARSQTRSALGLDDAGNVISTSPVVQIEQQAAQTAQQDNANRDAEYQAIEHVLQGPGHTRQRNDPFYIFPTDVFGLPADTRTYGVDASKYLSTEPDATAATAATADQQARVAALSQLMGKPNTWLPDASAAGQYDPSKAVQFDKAGFTTEQQKNQQAYRQQLQQIQDQMQSINDWFAASGNNSKPGPIRSITEINTQRAALDQLAKRQQELLDQNARTLGGSTVSDSPYVPNYPGYKP